MGVLEYARNGWFSALCGPDVGARVHEPDPSFELAVNTNRDQGVIGGDDGDVGQSALVEAGQCRPGGR